MWSVIYERLLKSVSPDQETLWGGGGGDHVFGKILGAMSGWALFSIHFVLHIYIVMLDYLILLSTELVLIFIFLFFGDHMTILRL